MEHTLHTISPKMKFFAVKGLLLVIFWQDDASSPGEAQMASGAPPTRPITDRARPLEGIILSVLPLDAWTKSRVNSFCLIWEAFLLGVLQFVAYRPSDFQEYDDIVRVPEVKKDSTSVSQ
ncbi:unnamed protein product, partial [Prorocentrum cordatum]